MTPNHVFAIVNAVAIIPWILLAVLPGRRWVTHTVTGFAVPMLFATIYTVIVIAQFSRSSGGFSSLPDVALLFSNPWLLLAGWIHYLAFDLLVGTWMAVDARERGLPHLLLVPVLLLTFLFGPAGWMTYQIVRNIYQKERAHSLSNLNAS